MTDREDARQRLRERVRDRRKDKVAGPFWEALDALIAFERADAVADWVEHRRLDYPSTDWLGLYADVARAEADRLSEEA